MHSVFLNILLQTIECLVFFDFNESIKRTNTKIRNFFVMFLGYMIMCAINIIFSYNIIINFIAFVLFHFGFFHYLYKHKRLFAVIYTLLLACIVLITEQSVIELIAIVNNSATQDFINDPYSYIILIVLSKSLLFMFFKIVSNIINKFKSNDEFHFNNLVYPSSLMLILLDFTILSNHTNLTKNMRILLAVSSIFLLIAVITTCIFQQKQIQKEQELIELKAIQQEQELNKTYFDLLEHQNEELQVFVHDTKKHYRTIYDLAESPDKLKEYIEGIVSDLEEINQIGKTSNKLLDLIITKYNYICDKQGIVFEKNIHQSNLNFISDNDLTSIFNNLFDNAVEAAKVSHNKSIFFGLNKVGNMLVIDITNSCDTPPIVKNHKLISTKNDAGLHGYGFKSICRAVKKYNGDIEWEYKPETKEFVVSIIFPVHSNLI